MTLDVVLGGISKRQLYKICGVAPGTIRRYERGASPRADVVARIAQALGIDEAELAKRFEEAALMHARRAGRAA